MTLLFKDLIQAKDAKNVSGEKLAKQNIVASGYAWLHEFSPAYLKFKIWAIRRCFFKKKRNMYVL